MAVNEAEIKPPIRAREDYAKALIGKTMPFKVVNGQIEFPIIDYSTHRLFNYTPVAVGFQRIESGLVISASTNSQSLRKLYTSAFIPMQDNQQPIESQDQERVLYLQFKDHPKSPFSIKGIQQGESCYLPTETFQSKRDLTHFLEEQGIRTDKLADSLARLNIAYASAQNELCLAPRFYQGNVHPNLALPKPRRNRSRRISRFSDLNELYFNDLASDGSVLTRDEEIDLAKVRDSMDSVMKLAALASHIAVYFSGHDYNSFFNTIDADLESLVGEAEYKDVTLTEFERTYFELGDEVEDTNQVSLIEAYKNMHRLELDLKGSQTQQVISIDFGSLWSGKSTLVSSLNLQDESAVGYLNALATILFNQETVEGIIIRAMNSVSQSLENIVNKSSQEQAQLFTLSGLITELGKAYTMAKDVYGQIIDTFCLRNTRLAISVAKRCRCSSSMTLIDKCQVGYIGLKIAARRFDYKRGCKFSTYATQWIRQSISRHNTDEESLVRVPAHMASLINKFSQCQSRLSLRLGRPATEEELASEMNCSVEEVKRAKTISPKLVSLNQPISDDGDATFIDALRTDDFTNDDVVYIPKSPLAVAEDEETKRLVNNALSNLPPLHEAIVRMRNGLEPYNRGYTLEETGIELNLTRERIRQIELLAATKLKKYLSRL